MKRIVSLMVVFAMVLTAFTGWSLVAAADDFVVTFDTAMDLGGIPGSVAPIEKTFSYAKGESKIAGGWIGGMFDAASTLVYTVDNGADNVINLSAPGEAVEKVVKGMYKDAAFITRFTADFTQTLSDTFSGASQTIRMYVKKPDGGKVLFATFVTDTNKQVSLEKTSFYEGDPIVVTYKNADKTDNNWVCIYKDPVGEQKYGDTDYTSQQYAYIDGDGMIVFNDPNNKVEGNDRTAVVTAGDDGSQTIIVYNQGAIGTLEPGNYHAIILGGSGWYAIESEKVSFTVVDGPIHVTSVEEMKQAGNYKLDTDIAGDLIISEGEYTIDLNGCIWDGSLSIKGGNVTINDSAEVKGAITSSTSDVIELPEGSTAVVTLNEIAVLGNKSE